MICDSFDDSFYEEFYNSSVAAQMAAELSLAQLATEGGGSEKTQLAIQEALRHLDSLSEQLADLHKYFVLIPKFTFRGPRSKTLHENIRNIIAKLHETLNIH